MWYVCVSMVQCVCVCASLRTSVPICVCVPLCVSLDQGVQEYEAGRESSPCG